MLQQQRFNSDSSAVAIILYDKSTYDLESEMSMNGTMKQKVRRIIKVLKPGGVSYGDITILVRSTGGSRSDIRGVKASTYALEGGKLVRHELDADNIAKDRTNYLVQNKFSLPAVQAGTILDFSYTIQCPVSLMFARHDFQHAIPVLYSELELFIPLTLDYLVINQGSANNFKEFDDTRKSLAEEAIPTAYMVSDGLAEIMHRRWVRRNIPAVIAEPFAPSLGSFRERLALRINGVHGRGYSMGVMDTWEKLDKSLLESFSFYQQVTRRHTSLIEKAKDLTAGIEDPLAKARVLFAFVRNKMHAEGYTDIYIGTDMEKLFQKQNASPSEINLMLVAMLRYVSLDAHPVLITEYGEAAAIKDLPDISQFSKTVCELNIAGERYYLDASGKHNAFGAMPPEEYNGYARAISSPGGRDLTLEPSSLKERQLVTVTTENADPANYIINIACQYGTQMAARQRNAWKTDTVAIRKYIIASLSKLGMDASLQHFRVSGLDNPDTSLVLKYAVRIEWAGQGNVYFNPHFFSYFSENPFKNAQRSLPIALPTALDLYYNVQLQVPAGYQLDDAPKPAVVTLNEVNHYKYLFEYDEKAGSLKLSTRIHMEHTWYPADQYEIVKQFFDKIIESQQKTYVFRKS